MAKKHKLLYDRLTDYAKKYQSGLDIVTDYNSRFAEVQEEFANYLVSILAVNDRAEQYLDPLIVTITSAVTAGLITRPTDFRNYISASYNGYPVHKLSANQMETYEQIFQRKGDLTKNRVNICAQDGKWLVKPTATVSIITKYVKTVPLSTIAFTYTSGADEDIMTYSDSATVDFVWDAECIPILIYMMLEKYGISVREQLLQQYALLGLGKEEIKA